MDAPSGSLLSKETWSEPFGGVPCPAAALSTALLGFSPAVSLASLLFCSFF